MTDKIKSKRQKLSNELLIITGGCLLLTIVIYMLLSVCAAAVIEIYCESRNLVLSQAQWNELDTWVLSIIMVMSVLFFIILFLALIGERLSYIPKITKGIEEMGMGHDDYEIPLEENNELTQLAESINYLSKTRKEIRQREQALNSEKEQLIRTLSHDIRTPLTSILSYSDLLLSGKEFDESVQKNYLALIKRKAEQIKDLTDVLLEGSKRNVEKFEDSKLLFEQLTEEFSEGLEEEYALVVDLSECSTFEGYFDLQELRRIFDNLASNIVKYADAGKPVVLKISNGDDGIVICQKNHVLPVAVQEESYNLGIQSIRRIVHNYNGNVEIEQDKEKFEIIIRLLDF